MKKLFMASLLILALGAGSVSAQDTNAAKKPKLTGPISGGGSATAGGTTFGVTPKKPSRKKKQHKKRQRRHSRKS